MLKQNQLLSCSLEAHLKHSKISLACVAQKHIYDIFIAQVKYNSLKVLFF